MSGNNENDNCNGASSKQQKFDDEANQDESVSKAGSSSIQVSLPSIFKLTIDCCDEIFEYLSLKDLHSIGRTCKRMQRVAGKYFKRNYKGCEKFTDHDGIFSTYYDHEGKYKRTPTSGFNRFLHNISYYYGSLGPLNYIKSHSDEFESVDNIYLVCTHVDVEKMKYFQQILPQIETVRIHQCTGSGDIYDVMLKFCKNLKNLVVMDDLGQILNLYGGNGWLHKCYPQLEYLQLKPRVVNEIPILSTFFERNPSVQHFSTTSSFLWMNQDILLKSNTKLNILDVNFCTTFGSDLSSLGKFRDLFNEMHEKGFYKRLHLDVECINQEFCDEIVSFSGIEKLNLHVFNDIYSLHRIIGLKELILPSGLKPKDIEILAINLVNLEKVSIKSITSNDLLPFMRCSRKLQKLYIYLSGGGVLNLAKLNKEREKLLNASKVIIYLNDTSFMATKWTVHNGDSNLKFTGIRRISSV